MFCSDAGPDMILVSCAFLYISLRHQLKYKTEFNWVKLCYLQVCIFTAPLISLRLGFRRIFSSVNVFGILTSTRLLPPWLCYNQSYLIDKKMLSLKCFLDFLHVELVIFFYHSITWAIPSMCNLKLKKCSI
jgi:hypothetical protein